MKRSRSRELGAATENTVRPAQGQGNCAAPSLHVQPSKGLPNLNRDALLALPTQRLSPRYGLRVVDGLKVAGLNDVVAGTEEIDTVRVHSVGSHAAL
jgi:hypothetical protein